MIKPKKPVARMVNGSGQEVHVTTDLVPIYERKGYNTIQHATDHDALVKAQGEIAELKAMVMDLAKGKAAPASKAKAESKGKKPDGVAEKLIARVKGSTEEQLQKLNKELKLKITLSNYSEMKEKRAAMIDVITVKYTE